MAFSFGSGVLFGTRTDVANSTPVNFGLIQEVTMDETATIKELIGQFQRPVAIARGMIKTTFKAKIAKIGILPFADLFYGLPRTATPAAFAFNEAGTITTGAVTVANAATWLNDDGGVIRTTGGLPFTKVASAPAAGQYSVAAGVYSFATGDNGTAVQISYTYAPVNAALQKLVVTNQLLGTTPTFKALLYTTFLGVPITLSVNKCTSSKLSFQTKLEDFVIPEFDFSAFDDGTGAVLAWNFAEVA
ncbi:MAG: hypothetical protein ACREC9_13595 [Methylocella sp.]